jgi:hypothetical protein
MKNKTLISLVIFSIILLTACGAKATASPTPNVTATPDLCSKENLPGEVNKINDLMREFDDYSRLASSTPQDKLVQVIPSLQEVRRRAQAQETPQCLMNLKVLQINHMNTVIEILMAFMGNAKAENVNQGIAQARELHMQYDVEIARLLGLTLVPAPTGNAPVAPAATTAPTTSTTPASGLSVLNPGPDVVTLFATPDPKAGGVATLAAGATAVAFGKTADGLWIQVEVPGQPGQKAWVSASVVQVSGELPVVTP